MTGRSPACCGAMHEQHARSYTPKASQVISANPDRRKARYFSRIVTPIGAALGVDHRELVEAAAGRRQLGLAPGGIGFDRHAVDQPGQRQGAALGLDDDAGAVAVLDVELGAVGREGDLHGGLEIGAGGVLVPRLAEALERRRQVGAGDQRARRRAPRRGARGASRGGRRHRTAAARRRCGRRGPGVAAPSGRPTHTAMVWRPS